MIIGLLELHHHDENGNLLSISKGHNIIFDTARVPVLFNPCIIDSVSSFVMYFSEFQETLTSYYNYWDSSLISSYATSTITLSATDDLSTYTKMYSFTGVPTLPGSTARTLRVVGLRIPSSTICTAITLTTPIDHGISTYVTGYYKLIMGVEADSNLFGNIYNWRSRVWSTFVHYIYKKDFYPSDFVTSSSYSLFNYIGNETIASLTARTQSVYNSFAINSTLTTPILFGSKLKDRDSSVALMHNGGQPTRSRVFIHAAGATDLYGNIGATQPTSEGSITIGATSNTSEYSSAVCLKFKDTGEVGVAQYRTIIYPLISNDTNLPTSKFTDIHRSYYTKLGNNNMREYLIFNSYFSDNRKWGVLHYTHIYDYYSASFSDFYKLDTLSVWYKGLYWTYSSGVPCFQNNGVITSSGVLFYAQDATPTILRRYDVEKRYEVDYAEETQTISGYIQGYQIDESTNELIVVTHEEGPELVTNGTFDTDASGWTAETSSTIASSGGVGVYTAGAAGAGFYQVISTSLLVDYYYQFKIDYLYNPTGSQTYINSLMLGFYGPETTRFSTIKIYVKGNGVYTDGRFYIYDSSGNYIYWNFEFTTTWTELTFNINSISGSSGTMNWKNINRYRFGLTSSGETVNVDNIRFYDNYGTLFLTNTCESITNWSSTRGTLNIDSTTHVEGSYSLKLVTTSADGYAIYTMSNQDWGPVPYYSTSLSGGSKLNYKTYRGYFTPLASTTKLKVWSTIGGTSFNLDNISLKRIENGRIYKFDCDDITTFMEYNHSNSNFSSLAEDSMLVPADPSRWYWRVGQGKMVWVGKLSSSKIIHYWNGSDTVETYTETTAGTIIDLCVTDDWSKICYAIQSGTICTWFVRSLVDGSRWSQLFSWSSTITGNGGCYVDLNWMFILSGTYSWGYRVNLLTYAIESWPCYSYDPFYTNTAQERGIETPNRSIIPGSVMYNFRSIGQIYYADTTYPTYAYLILNLVPIDYGWDGTQWIHNHTGNKLTHYDAQDLPLFDSVAFGDGSSGSMENYVVDEYVTYVVNPSGYVFDNSMTYTLNSWIYAGNPQYEEETFSLEWADPLTPANITITLSKVVHPDWLCFETDPDYVTVTFDTGLKGIQLNNSYTMSYFGEFYIDSATAGTITFYKDCNGHSITVKYYWIRRE